MATLGISLSVLLITAILMYLDSICYAYVIDAQTCCCEHESCIRSRQGELGTWRGSEELCWISLQQTLNQTIQQAISLAEGSEEANQLVHVVMMW